MESEKEIFIEIEKCLYHRCIVSFERYLQEFREKKGDKKKESGIIII